jgi:hypothetical protein
MHTRTYYLDFSTLHMHTKTRTYTRPLLRAPLGGHRQPSIGARTMPGTPWESYADEISVKGVDSIPKSNRRILTRYPTKHVSRRFLSSLLAALFLPLHDRKGVVDHRVGFHGHRLQKPLAPDRVISL